MPYKISWDHNTVHARYFGHVTDREVAMFSREVQGDERFESLRYVVEDFRECNELTYSDRVLEELSATDAAAGHTNPRIKIAVITRQQKVMEMVNAYISKGYSIYPLRHFPSPDLADRWLRS